MKKNLLWMMAAILVSDAGLFASCVDVIDNPAQPDLNVADIIIKNAKIFTSDKSTQQATALVVKDGKFVYVGDEAGLAEYEGEVTDMGGKFIIPGIIDSHMHITIPVGFEYAPMGERIEPNGKVEALEIMAKYIKDNPGEERYRFLLDKKFLKEGEDFVKEDLDAICPDAELQIQEAEGHSIWVNSKILQKHGITDDTPDPIPGLAYYVRKDGHVTGNMYEGATEIPIILDSSMELTDEQVDAALQRWIDFSVKAGVCCVFDAGLPGHMAFHEKIYKRLCELDKQGKLPIYVDGSLVVNSERDTEEGLKDLKRLQREYNTEHVKVHTMKIFMDGTQRIHTAAMVTPYVDINTIGPSTAFSVEGMVALLKGLNEANLDVHLHTVGERASRTVLDGVEMAKKELGDNFHVKVTCAHLEVQDDADLDRFAKLGVTANFTPWWHADDPTVSAVWLGEERSKKQFRCKTIWDSGALVTWSSDNITFEDFMKWSPYLGMEIGMTRKSTEKTLVPEYDRVAKVLPPEDERMGIEEMLLGYTINGAKQLGIETTKGSITVGKDADFLVFDKDLLTAEHEGFSHNQPTEVYFYGKRVYSK
jgi:predicted amidohydrolase YtcJ